MIQSRQSTTHPQRGNSWTAPRGSVVSICPEIHGTSDESAAAHARGIVESALNEVLSKNATLAHSSSDEIVWVFPTGKGVETSGLLDSIRLKVRTTPVPGYESSIASFSAGVADGSDGTPNHELLERARENRLAAKRQGGDRVQAQVQSDRSTPHILLAEDDTLTARLIIHRLKREGYEVTHHEDGESALNLARTAPIDLAILDVKMPRMDGFEVLQRIKADPATAATPVVMLTGMGAEQDIVRALSGGASDYILKPFSPAELTLRVQKLLAG